MLSPSIVAKKSRSIANLSLKIVLSEKHALLRTTPKYSKLLPITPNYSQLLPTTLNYSQLLPITLNYSQLLPITPNYSQLLPITPLLRVTSQMYSTALDPSRLFHARLRSLSQSVFSIMMRCSIYYAQSLLKYLSP